MKHIIFIFFTFSLLFSSCISFLQNSFSNSTSQTRNNTESEYDGYLADMLDAMDEVVAWIITPGNIETITEKTTLEQAMLEIESQELFTWKWFITDATYYGFDTRFPSGSRPVIISDVGKDNRVWLMAAGEWNHNFNRGDTISFPYVVMKQRRGNGMDGLNGRNDDLMVLVIPQGIQKLENIITPEQETIAIRLAEKQEKINSQYTYFLRIDKSIYQEIEITQETMMMSLAGLGSPFQRDHKYKTLVRTTGNSQYGAIFFAGTIGLADPNFILIPELINLEALYYLYFTVNRISDNDHFITVEYIELTE